MHACTYKEMNSKCLRKGGITSRKKAVVVLVVHRSWWRWKKVGGDTENQEEREWRARIESARREREKERWKKDMKMKEMVGIISLSLRSSNFLLHTRFFILKFRSTLQEYAHWFCIYSYYIYFLNKKYIKSFIFFFLYIYDT